MLPLGKGTGGMGWKEGVVSLPSFWFPDIWHHFPFFPPPDAIMNLGVGGQGPGGSSEGGPVDGPHIALLLPPCVVLAASSIVSHQKLIVVWQTPFISPCTVPAPGVKCRRTRGSGIIAVVVASCTCCNVRHGAISQCTTLGLIRSLPLGRWGCLGGLRWAQRGNGAANVGEEWSSQAWGCIVCVWGKKTLATPDTQAVCSQHRNEGFRDCVTTTKHFKGWKNNLI